MRTVTEVNGKHFEGSRGGENDAIDDLLNTLWFAAQVLSIFHAQFNFNRHSTTTIHQKCSQ